MEINVTKLMAEPADLPTLSGSVAELGEDAGNLTWQNARERAGRQPLLKHSQIAAARDYFATFGAWSADELQSMDEVEINALLIQLVAGDAREYLDAEEAGKLAEYNENYGGSIYQSDDGHWFYYVGE